MDNGEAANCDDADKPEKGASDLTGQVGVKLSKTGTKVKSHRLKWKIEHVDEKMALAISGRGKSLYSPTFYVDDKGYKVGACAYLTGDGMSQGKYVSLFFAIYRGDHDADLEWPFRRKVTIRLKNQKQQPDIAEAMRPDLTSSSFRRPIEPKNTPCGFSMFCLIDELTDPVAGFLVNDTIIIELAVESAAGCGSEQ